MTCGCEVTLSKGMDDLRAELWMFVFGKLSFPLKHPVPFLNPNFKGKTFYAGDANALSFDQKQRLIESMAKKFKVSEKEIADSIKDGVIPILADHLILSICESHTRAIVFSDDLVEDPRSEDGEYEE